MADSHSRKSSRERKPTEKMAAFLGEEEAKKERRFFKNYGALKTTVKEARWAIKTEREEAEIRRHLEALEAGEGELKGLFDDLRKDRAPSREVRERMDRATAMVRDGVNALEEVLGSLGSPFDANDRKQIAKELLKHDYAGSVFGSSLDEHSEVGIKHAPETYPDHAPLERLDVKPSQPSEVLTEPALIDPPNHQQVPPSCGSPSCFPAENNPAALPADGQASLPVTGPAPPPAEQHSVSSPPFNAQQFAEVLADNMHRSRLPVPVPHTFGGNPLEFVEFERSFKTLIGSKIPPTEKLYYLKQYVTGEAKQAIEGFFYGNSEEAYASAWETLKQRFGHSFQVQRAFREKLNNWPKIASRDSRTLQSFADFLKTCLDAMPYVKGLEVLNDCLESQRLLGKLPEWLAARWNRQVTDAIEKGGAYPEFKEFVHFMSKEARIANNPISSLQALRINESPRKLDLKVKDKISSKKGSVFAVKSKEQRPKQTQDTKFANKPAKRCSLCACTDHQLQDCAQYKAKSLSDRKVFVKDNGLCFGCLHKGHFSQECKRRHKCEVCSKRHPTSLHEWRTGAGDANAQSSNQEGRVDQVSTTSHKLHFGKSTSTAMIVPVWVSSEQSSSKETLTYALLDTQSDASFILEDVAAALGMRRQPLRLRLSTMTSSTTIECDAVSDILVRGMTSPVQLKLSKCYTRDFIPADRDHIPTRDTADKWPHLREVAGEMPALQSCEVGLLIGYNCPRALIPRKVITGTDVEPYAIQTDLGWSIVGSANQESNINASQCGRVATRELPGVTPKDVLKALEADFPEKSCQDVAFSQEDIEFIRCMEAGLSKNKDGHLEMPLPFKRKPEMPNNRHLAKVRLSHLQKKMDRDESYKEHYKAFMTEIIDMGYAERAKEEGPPGSTNYIPHHGIYHRHKNKIRVVFDCSAKFGSTCLNEHLLKGPDLTNAMVGVLLRFRRHQVALMCDIEKMFFQFHVTEHHRDYLRFLWWEDNDTSRKPVDYRMKAHLFGAASSPGCANYGLKHLATEHKKDFPLASGFITRNFYVDDGITSTPTAEEAIQLATEAMNLCRRGGLRLHKFVSNSKTVVESIPESERSVDVTALDLNFEEPMERALGIWWNISSDHLCFKVSHKKQPSSRRGILSTVASLYDPLGFVAPMVLKGKRILQEMCRSGIGWDEPIPQTLQPAWEQWLEELPQLEELQIPRCYHPPEFGQPAVVQLHHFSDASTSGYGQCSYVRFVNEEGDVHCSLVFGKSRVTPSKVVTVPRLELTAAVVSAKVSTLLRNELELRDAEEFFWTDSKVVLGYLNNEARRFHTFVANRVQLIRERTSPDQWHYVPTDQNPADHASRGLGAGEIKKARWFEGPEFLWEKILRLQDVTPELKLGDPEVKSTVLAANSNPEQFDLLKRLTRISDWSMMINVLVRLRLMAKGARRESVVQARKKAEAHILQLLQRKAFPEEIQTLTEGKAVKNTSRIRDLDPYVDDAGTLRVGGRLQQLPSDMAHPVILPKDSAITFALIRHFHRKVQHQGKGITQNEIRARGYWVVKGSRVIAELVRNCVACRRLRRPQEEQKMADLPEDRTKPSAPFTHAGMDCFGPFCIKRGRSEVKRYGLLLTCFCSRGVHIEMLDDMSSDALINALRCFIAIRGAVQQIRCDQGSNFIGARNEFQAALKEMEADKVAAYLADQRCEFIFNAPHSSHVGGVWERQIRTVRSVLRATIELCPGRLTDSALRTFFYEAMALVNSRPLTLTNLNDPKAAPLTPNHLLMMKGVVASPPPGQFSRADLYTRKAWRRVQFLSEQFWSRWRKEYLLGLQERSKWTKSRRNIQVGDVVLIVDQDAPRMRWPLGIVTDAAPDADGLVRKVLVRAGTRNLDKKGRPQKKLPEYWRPVQKVVLLLEHPLSKPGLSWPQVRPASACHGRCSPTS